MGVGKNGTYSAFALTSSRDCVTVWWSVADDDAEVGTLSINDTVRPAVWTGWVCERNLNNSLQSFISCCVSRRVERHQVFSLCYISDKVLKIAPYGPWGSNAPRFICWFWRCINCLFVCLLTFLPSLLSFFTSVLILASLLNYSLTRLLPDVSIYYQNRPIPFPGRRC